MDILKLNEVLRYVSALCAHPKNSLYLLRRDGVSQVVCKECGRFWSGVDYAAAAQSLDSEAAEREKILTTIQELLDTAPVAEAGVPGVEWDGVLRPTDLSINVYNVPAGGSWGIPREQGVVILHIPTRIEVRVDTSRSAHANKAAAMDLLKSQLQDYCALREITYKES